MSRTARAIAFTAVVLGALPIDGFGQDSVLGTFTVGGKTVRFTHVYASFETSPLDASQKYLVLLVSDAPVAVADRSSQRLKTLATSGAIHAVKLRWKYGFDSIAVVPYHAAIPETGRAFAAMSTINISALDDIRINAEFKSKMLGQTWFFNAIVKAVIAKGGVAVLEPEVESLPPLTGGGKGDAATLTRALGAMGFEFTPDAFFQSIADLKPKAVTLFLQAGMSANLKNDQNRYALNHSVLFCAQSAEESAAVIQALLAAKADVKTKDPDNGTTPLVGAVQSCSVAAVKALVDAGSDLTAKSNGGTTALQLARIYQRADVVAVLEKAGAK
jgi:hypothetical protein